jgi:hypothetical protein
MSKDGFVASAQKDMRPRARVMRWFKGKFPRPGHPSAGLTSFAVKSAVGFAVFTVITYALIVNIVPDGWLTFGQAMTASLLIGALSASLIMYFALLFANPLRRAFISASLLTVVAAIGYGANYRFVIDGHVSEFSVGGAPLQGASLAVAIVIVLLLGIAMVLEGRASR